LSEELFEIETEETEAAPALREAQGVNVPDTAGDETQCGRARAVTQFFNGCIAQLGNEVFVLMKGAWVKQTGHAKRAMLRWWGSNPQKTGQWGAALQEWAVDPNEECAGVYYERGPFGDWVPIKANVADVYMANGRYNVVTKSFTPHELGKIVFGPLMHTPYDADILAACRNDDYANAPEQFKQLLGMIDYALSNRGGSADNGTSVDRDTVRYFQSVVAQILRPHAGFNAFVHVFGESGARKTTIMRALLSAPCGSHGINELSEAALAEHKFMRAGLVNRIANLSNDSAVTPKFVPFIKEVTSGILVTEKKFHDPCGVRLTAKLFSTMNVPQRYDDDSLGIENRLIVFKFLERNDNNRSAAGMQWMDANYYEPETRAWITHWLLAGLERCVVNGVESPPKPSDRALQWKEELLNCASTVRGFAKEFIRRKDGAFLPSNTLIDLAIETGYCAADEQSRSQFGDRLAKHIRARFGVEKKRKRVNGAQSLGFSGLEIVDSVDPVS
jgi:hypothetical protein